MSVGHVEAVAAGGDLDADGFDDLLVAGDGVFLVYGPVSGIVDLASNGTEIAGESYPGPDSTYLLHGPVSGEIPLSSADVRFPGESTADEAGYSVSGIGDIDDDGFTDLLIGAPYNDSGGSNAGAAYLILFANVPW